MVMYSFFMIAKITTFPVTSKYKWEKKLSRSQKKRRPYWNSAF